MRVCVSALLLHDREVLALCLLALDKADGALTDP
jgi:hypothetical protein